MRIHVTLASGGDERVSAGSLLFLRGPTERESEENPGALSLLRLGSASLFTVHPVSELADEFGRHVPLAALTLHAGRPIAVNMTAVVDYDRTPSTVHPDTPSWLVFGEKPNSPRVAVREEATKLRPLWTDAGLDTMIFD